MSRNLKLWNHWIAEVRELAAKLPCYFEAEEGELNRLITLLGFKIVRLTFFKQEVCPNS